MKRERRALAWIVAVRGSAPRAVGARMWVGDHGRLSGTVGGGRLEARVIEEAMVIARDGGFRLLGLNLTAELGMCCGGFMELAIKAVDDSPFWREFETEVNEDRVWSCVLEGDERGRCGFGVLKGTRVYTERLSPRPRLVIFGAGHIACEVAPLAAKLGFRVVVVDDRADFASDERFGAAERRIESVDDFFHRDRLRVTDYVLVLTRSHDMDQRAVERIAPFEVAYAGMIGSRRKVERTKLRARAAGVPAERLALLRAPVGLAIGAESPEEIAVAIAAELVKVRRGQR